VQTDAISALWVGVERLAYGVQCQRVKEAGECNHEGISNGSNGVHRQPPAGPSPDGLTVKESDAARPISAYGWSKLMAEKEALERKNDLPVVIVRPSPVYGPRDRDFLSLFKMIKLGLSPVIGHEERYIHLTHVRDVVEGTWLASRSEGNCGSVYFLADERSYSWREIGQVLGRVLDTKIRQLTIPKSLSWLVARMAELWAALLRRPATLNREKRREMLARYWLCDTTRAREDLSFRRPCPRRPTRRKRCLLPWRPEVDTGCVPGGGVPGAVPGGFRRRRPRRLWVSARAPMS